MLAAPQTCVLPKQKIPNREAAIHGVEQIAHFGVRPDERALDIRQTDVADINVVQQTRQVVVDSLEASFQFAQCLSLHEVVPSQPSQRTPRSRIAIHVALETSRLATCMPEICISSSAAPTPVQIDALGLAHQNGPLVLSIAVRRLVYERG
jgi:hypothetical protein